MKTSGYKLSIYSFYITCFIGLFIEWMIFGEAIGKMGNKMAVTIVKGIGDCAMMLIIYWLLPNKFKGLTLIIIWLASLFFIGNLWYCRFWGNFLPATSYHLSSNVNQDLINSIKGLIHLYDIIFLLIPLIITSFYFFYFRKRIRKQPPLTIRLKTILVSISVIAFLIAQIAFTVTVKKNNIQKGFGPDTFGEVIRSRFAIWNGPIKRDYVQEGMVIYWLRSLISVAIDLSSKKDYNLNKDEVTDISLYLKNVPVPPVITQFVENSGKNLIIIIVESLNANVINRNVNGREVTPFMNSLINTDGTIAALNIIPQVKEGCSNDGQLLMNTGLLPLSKGISSMLFDEAETYPKLVDILVRPDAAAIFADNGDTWNQTNAYRSYGFKEIHTLSEFTEDAERIGRDKAMFRFSENIIDNLKTPFFIEFVTISMHVPFTDKSVPVQDWLKKSQLPNHEMNYLNMVNYFDNSLKEFFEYLKRKNLYDDSIIVIVSDHSQGLTFSSSESTSGENDALIPMMFMAVNTGYNYKRTEIAGQVNVFPTILQIMNINNNDYHGLGRSLLDPALNSVITPDNKIIGDPDDETRIQLERSYSVSDSIIRGNYFKEAMR